MRKSYSILLVLALAFVGHLWAQPQNQHRPDPARMAKHMTERLNVVLNLSEQQYQKIEALNLEFAKQIHTKHEAKRSQNPEAHQQRRELGKQIHQELANVLNKEQQEQLAAHHKAKREAMMNEEAPATMRPPTAPKQGEKKNKVDHHIERLQQVIKLTSTQIEQMKAIHAKYEPKMEAMKDEKNHQEMKKMHEEHKAKISQVLNEAQRVKFAQLPPPPPHHHHHRPMPPHGGEGHHPSRERMGGNARPNDAPRHRQPEMNIHPNPSQRVNTITYQVETEGKVKIDLLDKEGNFIRTLKEGQHTTGEHQLQVDLNDLQQGNYLYSIQTPDGRTSQQVLIRK